MGLRKRIMILITVMLLLLAVSLPLLADFGPKPSITVVVENAPKEEYYLDLLIPDFEGEPHSNVYDESKLDKALLDMLRVTPAEGWHAAFTVGTQIPLFGKLTGEPSNDGMVHSFSYFGTPNIYRIFVVTESGKTFLSGVIEKKVFQERITVRLGDDTISESKEREGTPYSEDTGDTEIDQGDPGKIDLVKQPNLVLLYLGQFARTFIPTLIIEFLLLLLFRIPVKRNLLAFFGVNLLTQVFLSVIMTGRLISQGVLAAFIVFVPLELCIVGLECVLYLVFLRDIGKARRVLYAVVANVVSAAMGGLLLLVR